MPDSIQKLYGYKSANPKRILEAMIADYGLEHVIGLLKENVDEG